MGELVDPIDSKSVALQRVGSNPTITTIKSNIVFVIYYLTLT